jgi:hypothetical protein
VQAPAYPKVPRCNIESLVRASQCCVLSVAAAGFLLLDTPTAQAISGGKESVGIFVPLDDADLSGMISKLDAGCISGPLPIASRDVADSEARVDTSAVKPEPLVLLVLPLL